MTRVLIADPNAMHEWGIRLGRLLKAGDLVLLHGGLGAGKTTLTRGIAEGLEVRGPITSPTFVLSRVHPSLVGGPALVHVDAYRLEGNAAALDDLDLDDSIDDSVTVIEWGADVAEGLAPQRLDLFIAARADDVRVITLQPVGERFDSLVSGLAG